MSENGSQIRSILAEFLHWLRHVWRRRSALEKEDTGSPIEVPRQPVGHIYAQDGHPKIALVDLGQDISCALRRSWDAGHLTFESGGVIESKWLQALFASGSTAASSLLAGNVFLSTANPATLMTIGAGVGSAVVGPGGTIVGQAAFVAAKGALLPVVTPVMLFVAVSSIITGARLDRLQKNLGALSEVVERVRRLNETEAFAKFQSARAQLNEVSSQFEHSQRFTDGMKLELVQARGDLRQLQCQFRHLTSQEIGSRNDARRAVSDINLFFLSSVMDIHADVLRLRLTLQDDPRYAGVRQAALDEKVRQRIRTFKALLDQDPIKDFAQRQQDSSKGAVREWFRSFLGIAPRDVPPNVVEDILETFEPIRERIERWTSAVDSATDPAYQESIVVYQDRDGERALHAHHTRDLVLKRMGA